MLLDERRVFLQNQFPVIELPALRATRSMEALFRRRCLESPVTVSGVIVLNFTSIRTRHPTDEPVGQSPSCTYQPKRYAVPMIAYLSRRKLDIGPNRPIRLIVFSIRRYITAAPRSETPHAPGPNNVTPSNICLSNACDSRLRCTAFTNTVFA